MNHLQSYVDDLHICKCLHQILFTKLRQLNVINNQVDNWFRIFHRVFWTFKQCCNAFNFCKPIVQVDGTFLYGKYRDTLLIATTQDDNSCVLPIVSAIVEGETLDT